MTFKKKKKFICCYTANTLKPNILSVRLLERQKIWHVCDRETYLKK